MESGPDEGARNSLASAAGGDENQVDEVTLVEVTGPDGKKTHDLAVLDRDEAGLLADQGLDLFPTGRGRSGRWPRWR